MNFKIFKYDTVNSTNNVAIDLIRKERKKNGLVHAKNQLKGRGTRGKLWISEKGNFFGSIFFKLEDRYPSFNEFSIINPVIISDIIKKFCKNKTVSIKWPNDILINKKKICGILQEVITLNNKKFLIIGIGVNIVSHPKLNGKYKATNIFHETKKKRSIKELLGLIIKYYENFFLNINDYDYLYFKKKLKL